MIGGFYSSRCLPANIIPPSPLMSSSSRAEIAPSFEKDSMRFEVKQGTAFPDFFKIPIKFTIIRNGMRSNYHFLFDHVIGNLKLRAYISLDRLSVSLELSTRKPRRNIPHWKHVNTNHWKKNTNRQMGKKSTSIPPELAISAVRATAISAF
jgi:hypothetical protein